MTPATALDELRALDQWVCWREESRNGKPTKVPYKPDGRPAASNDPTTWSPYEAVVAVVANFAGLGFVFTPDDPFAGVDIDGALRDGHLHPDVIAIIEQLDSYSEWSPSCTGVHVLLRAVKPAGGTSTKRTPWGDELAIYDRLRYFAITGDRLPSAPETIEERQAELQGRPREVPAVPQRRPP
jgi:putative DNA primase/helicase